MVSNIVVDTRTDFRIFTWVTLAVITGLLGIDIHLSSMPHMMDFMHTDRSRMSQSISLFLLGIGSGMLIYGPLSDKYGRRIILMIGLCVSILANFASVLTTNIDYFLVERLIQGFGAGACLGLGRVIVADIVQGERYAIVASYLTVITGLSPIIGPILGSYIQLWFNWQTNFFLLGLFQILLFIFIIFSIPETNRHKNQSLTFLNLINNYKYLLKHPLFLGFTFLSGIGLSESILYATTSSFIFQNDLHVDVLVYGWLTMAVSLGIIVSRLLLPQSIRYFSLLGTIFIGLVLLLLSGSVLLALVMLESVNLILLMFIIFITLFSYPFIVICCSSGAITPFHDKRGSAGALFGGFQMLTAFVVSSISGLYSHDGILHLAISYTVLGMLGLSMYFFIIRKMRCVE
jgi:Bcr/CflA subfamily drug resistance transporter